MNTHSARAAVDIAGAPITTPVAALALTTEPAIQDRPRVRGRARREVWEPHL